MTTVLNRYLKTLEADLEVEVDLHGGRTTMAKDLRELIISTQKELESIGGTK